MYAIRSYYGLVRDIETCLEIDKAIAETDIMDLRANLLEIQQKETSTTRKVAEIDQFMHEELSEEKMNAFEARITSYNVCYTKLLRALG